MTRGAFATLLATIAVPVMVVAQAPAPATTAHQHEHATAQGHPTTGGQSDEMKQMHQKMMAEMAAVDQRLDGLVAQMNAAQGQAKVDAIAAVINEMNNDRKQMMQHMTSMMGHGGMMGGTMGAESQPGGTMGTSGRMMAGMGATFDPVCRAKMADNSAPTATYQGKTYQFCSDADRQAFLKDPAKYLDAGR
ncbi:MAG: YHS domain-containing protein [Bacteroidales bacterium]